MKRKSPSKLKLDILDANKGICVSACNASYEDIESLVIDPCLISLAYFGILRKAHWGAKEEGGTYK
ncbi:hypothetical protein GCM10010913_12520 [Paenibacillus aceti]|uniref:Uncharacterized protein n=1 Tax=Paenibacillus aceti TaxID=1820010 RepID=A0ABQ1VRI9_9BACL|nr:hypothetical protein GCM10010913_12520 [Paenibacillus aceti]